jgi:hypothetical protein
MRDMIGGRVRQTAADTVFPDDDDASLEGVGLVAPETREPPLAHELSPFIDEIEELLCSAAKMPLTSKALVDREQCLAVLDVLRANWPLEVLEAQRILANEGEVFERAEAEADQIRERAEREASLILDQSQLLKMAEVRAQDVIESAQQEAVQIRQQAERDARDVYEGLEQELDLLMRDIRELMAARLGRLRR